MEPSLALAKAMADAVEEKAREMGIRVSVAVLDRGGRVMLLHRMDDSMLVSIQTALDKAYTAVAVERPSEDLRSVCQPGAALFGIQHLDGGRIVAFGGGLPLRGEGGRVMGGVGVSGGTSQQDILCAEAAIKVYEARQSQR